MAIIDPGDEPPPGYEPPPTEPPPPIIILPPGALDPGTPWTPIDVGEVKPGTVLDLRSGQQFAYSDIGRAWQAYLDDSGPFAPYTTETPILVDAGLAQVARLSRLFDRIEARLEQIEAYLA